MHNRLWKLIEPTINQRIKISKHKKDSLSQFPKHESKMVLNDRYQVIMIVEAEKLFCVIN